MTDAETNQIIHEAIYECEHDWKTTGEQTDYEKEVACNKCETVNSVRRYSLLDEFSLEPSTPNYLEHGKPWGDMLNWAMKQEWWNGFLIGRGLVMCGSISDVKYIDKYLNINLIANERSLAEHIAEYLEGLKDV